MICVHSGFFFRSNIQLPVCPALVDCTTHFKVERRKSFISLPLGSQYTGPTLSSTRKRTQVCIKKRLTSCVDASPNIPYALIVSVSVTSYCEHLRLCPRTFWPQSVLSRKWQGVKVHRRNVSVVSMNIGKIAQLPCFLGGKPKACSILSS